MMLCWKRQERAVEESCGIFSWQRFDPAHTVRGSGEPQPKCSGRGERPCDVAVPDLIPSRQEALKWAAKVAGACRCTQEVREIGFDPELDVMLSEAASRR